MSPEQIKEPFAFRAGFVPPERRIVSHISFSVYPFLFPFSEQVCWRASIYSASRLAPQQLFRLLEEYGSQLQVTLNCFLLIWAAGGEAGSNSREPALRSREKKKKKKRRLSSCSTPQASWLTVKLVEFGEGPWEEASCEIKSSFFFSLWRAQIPSAHVWPKVAGFGTESLAGAG